jgi:hypothetical protein
MAVRGPREKGYHPKRYQAGDIRRMQLWDETVGEAVVVLEGNIEVMSSLRQLYLNLEKDSAFPHRDTCADEIADFANQLDAIINDFRISIGRANALIKIISDRKELVSASEGIVERRFADGAGV